MKLSKLVKQLSSLAIMICWMLSIQSKVIKVQSVSEYEKHTRSGKPLVVKFSANWCGACQMIEKEFEQLTQDPTLSNVDFIRVDVDKVPDLAEKEAIISIPTFLYIKNGVIKGKTIGGQDPQNFQAYMQQKIQQKLLKPDTSWWPDNGMWKKTKCLVTKLIHTIWSIGSYIVGKIGGFLSIYP